MAYKNLVITPTQYKTQDTVKETQFYKGFSTVNNTKSVTLYDNELVKQDIINQFNTRKGERVMLPNFGTIVWNLLYDPLTDELKQDLQDDIRSILAAEPRVTVESVNVVEKDFGILLEVNLNYKSTNQSDNLRLAFDKELGLSIQ